MSDVSRVMKLVLAFLLGALVLLGAQSAWAADAGTGAAPAKASKDAKDKAPSPAAAPAAAPAGKVVEIAITENGYEPSPLKLKKGEPVTLRLTRKTEETCATEILIDGTDVNVPLPLNKAVDVPFTPAKTGTVKYGCAMGKMISGVLLVE